MSKLIIIPNTKDEEFLRIRRFMVSAQVGISKLGILFFIGSDTITVAAWIGGWGAHVAAVVVWKWFNMHQHHHLEHSYWKYRSKNSPLMGELEFPTNDFHRLTLLGILEFWCRDQTTSPDGWPKLLPSTGPVASCKRIAKGSRFKSNIVMHFKLNTDILDLKTSFFHTW